MTPPETTNSKGLRFFFRSLRHRNFRLFFFGQGVSVIGTWMQWSATGWLIKLLAEDRGISPEFWLGFIKFIGQIPIFALPLFTGVLADRWDKRRTLMATQALAMVQAFILSMLVYTGVIELWHMVVLSLAVGLVASLDIPTRHSFTADMVEDRADLGNAVAMNSSIFNIARVLGPLVAGSLILTLGIANCFFINALTYLAVLGALAMMRLPDGRRGGGDGHVLHRLAEGFRYATGDQPIRTVLLLLAAISLLGGSYDVLLPVVADRILGGSAGTYTLLLSAIGMGALIGVIYLATRPSVRTLKGSIAGGAICLAVMLMALSLSHILWLSLLLLMGTGFGMMIFVASANTFLQVVTDDDKRGRIMSLWTMCFVGMLPFGSLLFGTMGKLIGVMPTFRLAGVACLAAALVFLSRLPKLRRLTHPVYVRKGLIPEVVAASGQMPPQPETPESLQETDDR